MNWTTNRMCFMLYAVWFCIVKFIYFFFAHLIHSVVVVAIFLSFFRLYQHWKWEKYSMKFKVYANLQRKLVSQLTNMLGMAMSSSPTKNSYILANLRAIIVLTSMQINSSQIEKKTHFLASFLHLIHYTV